MNGVLDASGGLNEQMDPKKLAKLSAEGQRLAFAFDLMKRPVRALQRATQAGLFPGVIRSLQKVRPLLGGFRDEMKLTGTALGHVTERAADFAVGAGPDLQLLMQRNALYIERTGTSGIFLASALRHVLATAGPLLGWLTKSLVKWSAYIDRQAEAGRQSGKLAGLFWKTRVVATKLGHILANVAGALFGIGQASSPLGGQILDGIEKSSAAWERWSKSATGQRDMRRYFAEMKPTIWELGRLTRDLVKGLVSFGNAPGLAPLIRQIRTELLPVLLRVSSSTAASFGPTLIDATVSIGRMLDALSGGIGPLTLLISTLGLLAQVTTALITAIPGGQEFAVTMMTIGLATRYGLKFAGLLTGLRSLTTGFAVAKGATSAWTLAIVRAQVAAGFGLVLRGLAAGFWALNAAMVANPIGAVVLGLVALGAGLVVAYRKSEGFRNVVNGIADAIKSVVSWLGRAAKAIAIAPSGRSPASPPS